MTELCLRLDIQMTDDGEMKVAMPLLSAIAEMKRIASDPKAGVKIEWSVSASSSSPEKPSDAG